MLEANEKWMRELSKAFWAKLAEELYRVFTSKRSRRPGPSKLDTKPMKIRFSISSDN